MRFLTLLFSAAGVTTPRKYIVLVGGGHAHLQVIKALTKAAVPDIDVTLIDPNPLPSYSGMVPGCVSDLYSPRDAQIDLEPLTAWAGIRYVKARVLDLVDDNTFALSNNETVRFDIASLDVGSGSRDADKKGVREHSIPTRPIHELISKIESSELSMKEADTPPSSVVVCGAGPAGIELALAMRARWSKAFPTSRFNVTLLESGSSLLPNESDR